MTNTALALEIYAHRGGRGLSPENTLVAYKKALAIGVDYVDMDVNMTKDGVVVVTHDFSLNPYFTKGPQGHWIKSKNILIKSLTLKQLQRYNVCSKKPNTMYAKLFSHQVSKHFCKIPTLTEVIHYVKQRAGNRVGFQIEIKTNPLHPSWSYSAKKLAKAVVKIIHQQHIAKLTEVQAFDFRCLYAVQKLDPKIKTAYITQFDSKQQMLNSNPKLDTLWTGGPLLKNYNGSLVKMIAHLGGKFWDPQDVEVNKADVKKAHQLGLKVVVWNLSVRAKQVFDPKMIRRLIQWGVDGIITDRPDKLKALMQKLRMKLPPRIG